MWSWNRLAGIVLKVIFYPQIVFFGTILLLCLLYTFINPPLTTLMIQRATQGTAIKQPRFIPLSKIPKYVQNSMLYLEDHSFWEHHGIMPGAIREAFETNQRLGYPLYGGSTVTQQLARSLFLTPDKSYIRKYLEAGTALIMEAVLGKKRILELYLNYIEWGPGVFGVETGARYHYGSSVRDLEKEQFFRMAAIITNPLRFNVKTLYNSRGMTARYEALVERDLRLNPQPPAETPAVPAPAP